MRFSVVRVQAVKELDQFRRDKLTVGLAFVLPVMALMMYGFATRLEALDIPVSILNYDNIGKLSRELVDRIYASVQLVPARPIDDRVFAPLDTSQAQASIVIPPDFTRNIAAGRPAHFQAVIDGTDVNNARVISNALIAITQSFEQVKGLVQGKQLIQPAVRLWYNPGRKEALYIVPGAIALVLWIFPAILSTLALVREKEQGTILQVYASNLTPMEFIGGKAVAYILIGLGEFLCLLIVAMTVFGLQAKAELFTFAVITLLYVSSGVLFGLWAATRANTQMTAIQIVANVGFLATMLFSGFIYPLRNVLWPLSLGAYAVPAMYFILVCRNEFVRGGDWLGLWYAPVALFIFDAFFVFILSKFQMELPD